MSSIKMTLSSRSNIVQHKYKRKDSKIGYHTCKAHRLNRVEDRSVRSQCVRSGHIGHHGTTGKSSSNVAITKQVHILPLEDLEQHSFAWFLERSAFKLPGIFYTPAFVEVMFQASTLEPAVRHAIVSLASAHQEDVYDARPGDQRNTFTVKQYSLAITKLRPCLSIEDTVSLRLALMISMIFNAQDALSGSYTSALTHLEHGVKLLSYLKGVVCSNQLDGWLVTLLIRALVQAKFLGQLNQISCKDLIEMTPVSHCSEFRSIFHARRDIENILMRIFDILDHQCSDVYFKHDHIMFDLQKWKDMHKMSTAKPLSLQNSVGYELLMQYHRMSVILAAVCLEPWNEMIYDHHTAEFADIIDGSIRIYERAQTLPQDVIKHHDPEPSSQNSIADIGIITPLHFVAVHCRQPYLRRRALALLSGTRRREGIFSAPLILVLGSKLIEIEEDSFFGDVNLESRGSEQGYESPILKTLPQSHRLNKITIVLPDDKNGALQLKCIRGNDWICKEYDLASRTWSASQGLASSSPSQSSDLSYK